MDNHSDSATQAEGTDSVFDDTLSDYFSHREESPFIEPQEKPEVINLNDPAFNAKDWFPSKISWSIGGSGADGNDFTPDDFRLETIEDMAYVFALAAECYPEDFAEQRDFWLAAVEVAAQKREELETKINEATTVDMLVMAGIIPASQASITTIGKPYGNPAKRIIEKVLQDGKFPKQLKLSFGEKRLCVNKVPTLISEDDVRDLYNGLFGLRGYDEAIEAVSKTLVDKLTILFGVNNEEPLVEETSSEDE
jgi:hypothetical protein